MSTSRKKILVFLGLTLLFSSVFYTLSISRGTLGVYSFGLMWCPGAAALLTQLIFQHSLRGLGWGPGKARYLFLAYGLPLAYAGAVYALVWLTGLGGFIPEEMARQAAASLGIEIQSPLRFLVVYLLVYSTGGLLVACLSALGEEIGWRGLLVPELAHETTFTRAALISGGIWALWHMPMILFSDYNSGAPLWFAAPCFVILAVGMSFPMAWLRLKSGSLWPAVVLHAAHNMFIQAIFTPLTAKSALTPYLIDEFGIGLALAAAVIAFLFWRKRKDLPAPGVV